MKVRCFTLLFDSQTGRFDDTELQAFVAERHIIEVRDHFAVVHDAPLWAVLVCYRDTSSSGAPARAQRGSTWRDGLDPADRTLFDAMRDWRRQRAEQDGKPPHLILTNRSLAELARQRPTTASGLREVHGLGDAKVAEYGADLLALLGGAVEAET